MANIVELILLARDEASTKINAVRGALEKYRDTSEKTFANSKVAIASYSASIWASIRTLDGYIKAANESEVASAKLRSALERLGGESANAQDALEKQAESLQRLSGVDDETVVSADALLATYGMHSDAILKLMPLIVDTAAATGRLRGENADLNGIALAVAKSMDGSTMALTRYGILMNDAQEKTFRAANETQRMAMILDLLKKNMGAAKAQGDTYEGRVASITGQIGNWREATGKLLEKALMPLLYVMQGAIDLFKSAPQWVQTLTSVIAILVPLVGGLVAAFGLLATLWPVILAGFGLLSTVVSAAALPVVAIGGALATVAGAAVLLYDTWRQVWTSIAQTTGSVINALGGALSGFRLMVEGALHADPAKIKAGWEASKAALAGGLQNALAGGMEILGTLGDAFNKRKEAIFGGGGVVVAPTAGAPAAAPKAGSARANALREELDQLVQLEAIKGAEQMAMRKQINAQMTQQEATDMQTRLDTARGQLTANLANEVAQLYASRVLSKQQAESLMTQLQGNLTTSQLKGIKDRLTSEANAAKLEAQIRTSIIQVEKDMADYLTNMAVDFAEGKKHTARELEAELVRILANSIAQQITAYYALAAAEEVAQKGWAGVVSGAALMAVGAVLAAGVRAGGAAAARAINPTHAAPVPTAPAAIPDFAGTVPPPESANAGGTTNAWQPIQYQPAQGSALQGGAGQPGNNYQVNITVQGDDPTLARKIAKEVKEELSLLDNS